jgi:hypothetical protein
MSIALGIKTNWIRPMVLSGLYEFEFKQSAELIADEELGASSFSFHIPRSTIFSYKGIVFGQNFSHTWIFGYKSKLIDTH